MLDMLKRKSQMLLAGLVLLAMVLAFAPAYAREPAWYFSLGTGFASANEIDLAAEGVDLEADEVGNSAVFTAAVGYEFPNNFRTELEFVYHPDYSIDETYMTQDPLQGGMVEIETTAEVRSMAVMAKVFYDFPVHERMVPYLGAGIGYSDNEIFDIVNLAKSGALAGTAVVGNGASEQNFAYCFRAGIRLFAKENLALDIGYQYSHLGDLKTGSNEFQGVVAPPQTGVLHSHDLRVAVAFRF